MKPISYLEQPHQKFISKKNIDFGYEVSRLELLGVKILSK